jgi:hypothetical protein
VLRIILASPEPEPHREAAKVQGQTLVFNLSRFLEQLQKSYPFMFTLTVHQFKSHKIIRKKNHHVNFSQIRIKTLEKNLDPDPDYLKCLDLDKNCPVSQHCI